MRYDHRLRITRASITTPGTYDPETGAYTGGTSGDTVVLDCPADVQDAGESIPRGASGMPALQADATAFIPPSHRAELLAVVPQDVVTVYYPNTDRTAEGNVQMVRELDDVLLLVYR